MRCLLCGKPLSLLRKFADKEFCSTAHRKQFQEEHEKLALKRLIETRWPAQKQKTAAAAAPAVFTSEAEARKQPHPMLGFLPIAPMAFEPAEYTAEAHGQVLFTGKRFLPEYLPSRWTPEDLLAGSRFFTEEEPAPDVSIGLASACTELTEVAPSQPLEPGETATEEEHIQAALCPLLSAAVVPARRLAVQALSPHGPAWVVVTPILTPPVARIRECECRPAELAPVEMGAVSQTIAGGRRELRELPLPPSPVQAPRRRTPRLVATAWLPEEVLEKSQTAGLLFLAGPAAQLRSGPLAVAHAAAQFGPAVAMPHRPVQDFEPGGLRMADSGEHRLSPGMVNSAPRLWLAGLLEPFRGGEMTATHLTSPGFIGPGLTPSSFGRLFREPMEPGNLGPRHTAKDVMPGSGSAPFMLRLAMVEPFVPALRVHGELCAAEDLEPSTPPLAACPLPFRVSSPAFVEFEGIAPILPRASASELGLGEFAPVESSQGLALTPAAGRTRSSIGCADMSPITAAEPNAARLVAARPVLSNLALAGLAELSGPAAHDSRRPRTQAEPEPPVFAISLPAKGPEPSFGRPRAELLKLDGLHPSPQRCQESQASEAHATEFQPKPMVPRCRLETVASGTGDRTEDSVFREIMTRHHYQAAMRFWRRAPADLKWLALALPLVMVLWLRPFGGSEPVPAGEPAAAGSTLPAASAEPAAVPGGSAGKLSFTQVFNSRWNTLQQNIAARAGVELNEDFRSGLGAWEGDGEWSRTWSYDPAGFVRVGHLALYRPSASLADYKFEFIGQIERHAMSWAFRAADPANYYAMKLVIRQPGPLPVLGIERWRVQNGKESQRYVAPIPVNARMDTIWRVKVDVHGQTFVTSLAGQVVDVWSDDKFPSGGVGLFSVRGDLARIHSLKVSHQYDALGRLCAFLAPYSMQPNTGSWNQ